MAKKRTILKQTLLGILAGFSIMLMYFAYAASQIRKLDADFHQSLPQNVTLTSTSFAPGAALPTRCTCQGGDAHPALQMGQYPAGTQSVVLIAHDPDAPSPVLKLFFFEHWAVINLPAQPLNIPEGPPTEKLPQGLTLQNGFGDEGYIGPCPPFGQHRYIFRVYALRSPRLALDVTTSYTELLTAMQGHVLGYGELVGVYEK
jgi:Raf kinase inhibitor-like YbhB/YbcL family protein